MQENLYRQVKQHFNEPILMGFDLCRCIGYAEDEDDCYMIVLDPKRGIYKNSMAGGYTYLDCLKEQGCVTSTEGDRWSDFTRLDTLLQLNGAPKVNVFMVEVSD